MNILFFSRLFYPNIGGVEKHVLEISRILVKKGHRLTVVTEQSSSKNKTYEVVEGIRVFRIPKLSEKSDKKFKIWKWLSNNIDLIKDADVVHCHDVFFWYLPFRFMFPFKKVFTTFHGYESFPLSRKNILIRKISEKLSNGNICIGHFIKKWYGTKPDIVAYGGANKVKESEWAIKNKNSALFIGRLDDQTGILTYAEAMRQIREKLPDFDFLVIGGGNLMSKIDKNIKISNPINNASDYLKNYNFAFVSRYLSIFEAMAAKRLVFAVYDNPLKEDYLRMTPFSKYIVIFKSPQELVLKISYYLKNINEKNKLVDLAHAWVNSNTWLEMTKIYIKLWKK
jgi:glycosyltransferase involved in cell wall biosynthesis